MAGTVAQTHEKRGKIGVITLDWVADASDASVPDTELDEPIGGRILAIETNPGGTAPTDNYDVTLVDAEGHDVLEGAGVDRDTANTEKAAVVYSGTELHPVVSRSDVLTFNLDNNAVNSALGRVKIYYEGDHG